MRECTISNIVWMLLQGHGDPGTFTQGQSRDWCLSHANGLQKRRTDFRIRGNRYSWNHLHSLCLHSGKQLGDELTLSMLLTRYLGLYITLILSTLNLASPTH